MTLRKRSQYNQQGLTSPYLFGFLQQIIANVGLGFCIGNRCNLYVLNFCMFCTITTVRLKKISTVDGGNCYIIPWYGHGSMNSLHLWLIVLRQEYFNISALSSVSIAVHSHVIIQSLCHLINYMYMVVNYQIWLHKSSEVYISNDSRNFIL